MKPLVYIKVLINALLITSTVTNAQFPAVVNLAHLNGGNGFVINAEEQSASDRGQHAGDINNDGISDLIIGAGSSDVAAKYAGAVYVLFGNANGFPAEVNWSDLDGSNGFQMYGEAGHGLGASVSGAKDINGDGIDDLIISAPRYGASKEGYVPTVHVLFGSNDPFPALFDLNTLNGNNGFSITASNPNSTFDFIFGFGRLVHLIDDINGDGVAEITIGSSNNFNGDYSGTVYLIYGKTDGFPAAIDASVLTGADGFVIHGTTAHDYLGQDLNAGDFNHDGLTDLVINGLKPYDQIQNTFTTTYVLFGSNQATPAVFDLNNINGTNGFLVRGINRFGSADITDRRTQNELMDLNADGIDDLIIAYPQADTKSGSEILSGKVYVLYGTTDAMPVAFDLNDIDGSNGFVMQGTQEFERLGFQLTSVGDLNDDGFHDLAMTSFQFGDPPDPIIGVYVIFANSAGFPAGFSPVNLDGNNGFKVRLRGFSPYYLPTNLSAAGDINADGIDDILINTIEENISYVIYGRGDLIFSAPFD